jgi:hypothetical protein
MNELLLKYNRLDAFSKQELMDFLEFLIQKKANVAKAEQKMTYKEKILHVSTWSDEDIEEMQRNVSEIKLDVTEW